MAMFNLMEELAHSDLCTLGDSGCLRMSFLKAENKTGICDLIRKHFLIKKL
jgi:hypothetical protein